MSADDAAFELVCSKSSLIYDSDVIVHDDDDVDRQIIAQEIIKTAEKDKYLSPMLEHIHQSSYRNNVTTHNS
jgi:hypothetical protein